MNLSHVVVQGGGDSAPPAADAQDILPIHPNQQLPGLVFSRALKIAWLSILYILENNSVPPCRISLWFASHVSYSKFIS